MPHDELDRITAFLAGELSPAEMEVTEGWIAEEPKRVAMARDLRQSRMVLSELQEAHFSVDDLICDVKTVIHTRQSVSTPAKQTSVAHAIPLSPRRRSFPAWLRIAAVVTVLVGTTYGITQWRAAPAAESVRTTGRGERATIQLADGSTIVLGAQSQVRYAYPFGDRDRAVYLTGEAYFTVANQTHRPFVVYTAHAATQVLGTEFLVRAHPTDSAARVIVRSGKVVLRPVNAELGTGTVVTAGEMGQLTARGLTTVSRDVALDAYFGWVRGELTFQEQTLGSMIPELERWFDVKIVLTDQTLATTRITLTLDTESVDQTLSLLSEMSALSWKRTGNTVTVSPERPARR